MCLETFLRGLQIWAFMNRRKYHCILSISTVPTITDKRTKITAAVITSVLKSNPCYVCS